MVTKEPTHIDLERYARADDETIQRLKESLARRDADSQPEAASRGVIDLRESESQSSSDGASK